MATTISPNKLLVMMVGVPGSGKTHFAKNLEQKIAAKRLNLDLIRSQLFGIENRRQFTKLLNTNELDGRETSRKVIKIFDQQLEDSLKAGRAVILDSSQDWRKDRDFRRDLASSLGFLTVIAWMKTPIGVCIKRATSRTEAIDSHPFSKHRDAKAEIDRCLRALDEPGEDEYCIRVDGQLSFRSQYAQFKRYLSQLLTDYRVI